MKHNLRNALFAAALVGLSSSVFAAYGEVTLYNGTWTGKVDGSTKYTGSSMGGAEVACLNAMSSGTIAIKNSGAAGSRLELKSNVRVDGTGRTISGGGTRGMIYAANLSNVSGINILWNSSNWYGHYFRTCNGQSISGSGGTANLTYRIDNCSGGTGYNLTVGSPSDSGASGSRGSHNLETYGISGGSAGTVTSNDRSGGCGTLLNYSSNFSFSTNNGTRCNQGGGYAGFRTANTNGKTTVGTANSTTCGRGYFSVSGSRDCTISNMQTWGCGVWLQTTYNTRINSGTLRGGCWSITAGSGNSVNVVCQ